MFFKYKTLHIMLGENIIVLVHNTTKCIVLTRRGEYFPRKIITILAVCLFALNSISLLGL